MEILTVEKDGNGFIVNGTFSVAPDDMNMMYQAIKKWVEDGGTVEDTQSTTQKYVPSTITMRQARLQLLVLGLLDDVETAIENIADATTKKTVQIEWEYAKDVERDSPVILLLAEAISIDDTRLDNLFIEAVKL